MRLPSTSSFGMAQPGNSWIISSLLKKGHLLRCALRSLVRRIHNIRLRGRLRTPCICHLFDQTTRGGVFQRPVRFLLIVGLWLQASMADAAELNALVQASGGPQAATSQRLWSVVGEPAIGRSTGSSFTVTFGFLAGIDGSVEERPVDTTPPTTPMVTDDGAFTASMTQLFATWTSSDPETGIAEYRYAIGTQVGAADVVNWTSAGTNTEVTHTGLNLIHGATYYFSVQAKNRADLWSEIGFSDGILVDLTPPSAPGRPAGIEQVGFLRFRRIQYDSDGNYQVRWASASDPESGIKAYEIQERIGLEGTWDTVGSRPSASPPVLTLYGFSIRDRLHGKEYFYRVRAQNQAGLWGPWSEVSEAVTVDLTSPTIPIVTDDGDTTASRTTLHATWTSSLDPESGVVEYQYQIIQDSATGPVVVPWTSTETTTSVTRTELSLTLGATYYFSVKARNGAGLWSDAGTSDGITVRVRENTLPVITSVTPTDGATYTEADAVPIAVTASDPNGDPLEYQFLIDGVVKRAWAAGSTWSWDTTGTIWEHTLTVQVKDPSGRQVETTHKLFGYRLPPPLPTRR